MPVKQREESLVNPSHPPVPTEVKTVSEANFASDEAATAKALSDQETKTIRLYQVPSDSSDKPLPDEFVSVNGHNYLIQRGVEVEVPQTVYEVLVQAQRY